MATEPITLHAIPGKTVYFRLFRPADSKVFDFDDDTWETNLAACTTPKLAASEVTDVGDISLSLYVASLDLSAVNNADTPMQVVIQAVDDLTTDVILDSTGVWIANGQMLGQATGANVMQVAGASTPAITLSASLRAVVVGAVVAGTLTDVLFSTDLTEATDDHYGNGTVQLVCAFFSGALSGQSRPIVAYDGTASPTTLNILPAFTDAPSIDDGFVILGLVA